MKPTKDQIRAVMAAMGSKGGKAAGKPKGLAAMSPERRAEVLAASLAARRKKAAERDARPLPTAGTVAEAKARGAELHRRAVEEGAK